MPQTEYQKECARKAKTTHGMRRTRFYSIWCDMKKRCNNPNHKDYAIYGGKGIRVCRRWLKFENFRDDMLLTYFDGASIERINTSKGYNPVNCKWIPLREQSRNTSRTILSLELIEKLRNRFLAGESQASMARELNCNKSTIWKAINKKSWR
jgi:predicted DNA-binding protein (UPF0251 family)